MTFFKKIDNYIKGFYLGIFFYLLVFLVFNFLKSDLLNVYSVPFLLFFSLFLGQIFFIKKIKNIILFFAFLLFLGFIFSFIFKYIVGYSVDGNTYHLEAIYEFMHGKSLFYNVFESRWLNYYPKNIEIIFSGFVNPFVNYDFGRIFKFLLIVGTFFNLYFFLIKYKAKFKDLFYSKYILYFFLFIIVFNPVVIYQFFTLYVDDILYLLLVNFTIYLFRGQYLLSFILFSVMAGGKFTYIFYSFLVFFIFVIIKNYILREKIYFKVLFDFKNILFLLSGSFIGFYQYILNLINQGNPLYLLLGKDKVDIISGFFPSYFSDLNNFSKFKEAFSMYSFNGCYGEQCWYKLDFIHIEGIKKFFLSYKYMFVDTLGNGFGNIFYILLILSFFIFIYFIIKLFINRKLKNINKISLLFILIIFIIIGLIPSPWARYYPFVYLIPLFILFLINKKNIFKEIIIYLFMLNIILIIVVSFLFHSQMFINKYRENVWLSKDIDKIGKIYYYSYYHDSFSSKKLIKEYDFNENNFILLKSKDDILKKCNLKLKPSEKIIYCKNGIFIYPNYGSYIGEYMFLEYKKS